MCGRKINDAKQAGCSRLIPVEAPKPEDRRITRFRNNKLNAIVRTFEGDLSNSALSTQHTPYVLSLETFIIGYPFVYRNLSYIR